MPTNLQEIDSSATVRVESLAKVENITVNRCITVIGKVVAVQSAVKVSAKNCPEPLTKQDCTISDSCGTCRIVLWEDSVGSLVFEETYRFVNVTV